MNKKEILDIIFDENLSELSKILTSLTSDEINFVDEKLNLTPLTCAIETNNYEIVKSVLNKGANPNFCKQNISLPLINAIEISVLAEDHSQGEKKFSTNIIELLIKFGADINLPNYDGETSIEFAKDYHPLAQKLFEKL
jgi:ankyrin repeat protein